MHSLDVVELFCFRSLGYYGFGLTPRAAVFEAKNAGMPSKDERHGIMVKLPPGTTQYGVSSDVGSLQWICPSNPSARPEPYVYDKKAPQRWRKP